MTPDQEAKEIVSAVRRHSGGCTVCNNAANFIERYFLAAHAGEDAAVENAFARIETQIYMLSCAEDGSYEHMPVRRGGKRWRVRRMMELL